MTDKLDVLVENKNEYLEHLIDISTIPICKFFVNIANNCSSLKEFQKELVLLTKWNKQKQDAKMNTIHKLIEEDHATPQYMLKLLSEIISKSIKIKIIEHKSIIKSLKVYIPEWYEFLYKVCTLASNIFWKNPVLFYKKVSSIERQNNINVIEKITKTCIKNAVRSFIPLNQIINELNDIVGGGEINITNTQTVEENSDDTDEVLDANSDEDDDEQLEANSDEDDDEQLEANSDEDDDEQLEANGDTEDDDEQLEANSDEDDDEQLEANGDTEDDDEQLEANGDTEDDEQLEANGDTEEDEQLEANGDIEEDDKDDLDDTKEPDNTEYEGNKNSYSIKQSKIDDEIVKPVVILEKTKKPLKDEIVKTEEALEDEIVKPIVVLEKKEEVLKDEIVKPIKDEIVKPIKDEIVKPIVVLEKKEEVLKDEIVKPIVVLEKKEEVLKDEIVKPILVLEKTEEALEDEIVKPIVVLEKTEEALEDEIVKPIVVLEKTEEALEDEIVRPIVVLEKTEEALEDNKDDDEIVMNNKDIKVIRINKSFF